MQSGRTILLIFLCALFISSTGLSQMEPSRSDILNAVHKVDKEVAVLSTKMEGIERRLDQKIDLSIKGIEDKFGERLDGIDTQIKEMQGTLTWMQRGIIGIAVTFILSVVGYILKTALQNRG